MSGKEARRQEGLAEDLPPAGFQSGQERQRSAPLASNADLLELLDRVSLSGMVHSALSACHVHLQTYPLVCLRIFTLQARALSVAYMTCGVLAGLEERVGGFEVEAEWSHIFR